MIESIEIENFKKFEKIKLDDCKRLNLISGQNNTGKTSILEALFMFYDRNSPDFTLKQYAIRGVNSLELTPSSLWQPLFTNFDLEKKIKISLKKGKNKEEAIYSHNKGYSTRVGVSNQPIIGNQAFSSTSALTEALNIIYRKNRKNSSEANIFVQSGQIAMDVNNFSNVDKPASFVGAAGKGNSASDAQKLGKIDIETGLEEITEHLRILEPKLRSLSIVPQSQQPLIYADIGLSRKIPISYMGEGISKLLSILATIATSRNGIVCLDEIENGIHFSLFPKIWEIIRKMASEYNCQIFITTHSRDALQGLYEYSKTADVDDLSFYRLDIVNEKITPKKYDTSMIFAAIEREWELR